jgi:hypothetical protein
MNREYVRDPNDPPTRFAGANAPNFSYYDVWLQRFRKHDRSADAANEMRLERVVWGSSH